MPVTVIQDKPNIIFHYKQGKSCKIFVDGVYKGTVSTEKGPFEYNGFKGKTLKSLRKKLLDAYRKN